MGKDNKSTDIEVTVEIKHETNAAILVTDGSQEMWIPKSQIGLNDEPTGKRPIYEKGTTITISIPEWLAHAKGLI